VYDSVVGEFFRPQLRDVWYPGGAKFLVRYLELFRNLMLTYKEEAHRLRDFVQERGWYITPVRVLEVLIWIANEDTGEYR
jgi:hypothetical protein